jgi:hypothetical protein
VQKDGIVWAPFFRVSWPLKRVKGYSGCPVRYRWTSGRYQRAGVEEEGRRAEGKKKKKSCLSVCLVLLCT